MRSNHPFGILSGLVLLSTAALSSTAALASEPANARSLSVNYVQADLQNAAAAEALYHRIQRAARMVCDQPAAREVDRYNTFKSCYERAVDTAVANVGATTLTEVHRTRGHTQAAG